MNTPAVLDHASNTYLAVTLVHPIPEPASILTDPKLTSLSYVGPVGALQDVHLYSVPKTQYQQVKEQVFAALDSLDCVKSVDVQAAKQRVKRGDEL
ncbi:hypothetical protein FRC02_011652 [Tulasnella sp. 418]|nr:hypothetical protein FRC02_011652 [Tulasnella sp. 418]